MTVVTIDDDKQYIKLLKAVIENLGYAFVSLESEKDAQLFCDSKEPIDLIISDVEMPGYESEKIAKVLASYVSVQKTPIIITSGVFTEKSDFYVNELISCYGEEANILFFPKGNVSYLRHFIKSAVRMNNPTAFTDNNTEITPLIGKRKD